jgi:CubicO group peptidase (beta-lactamase class C family)
MGRNPAELIQRHNVPGAQVAVLVNGEVEEYAAGVLSLRTRIETTTDSVFQIGSITKIWTATLVQKLVNEGVLDLDCPIRSYLPEFALSDPAAAESVTTRHLLTHSSGIDGDPFTDTGRNADAIEKFVARLPELPQLFPPGERFSYSNSGFVVLGRLVEVLRGKPFHDVLRDELVTPLGLQTVCTDWSEAVLHRTAVGHTTTDDELRPVRTWGGVYSNAPVGTLLAMSARDLLTFANLHLTDPALAPMRAPQLPVRDFGWLRGHFGLGWQVLDDDVIGHNGVIAGQYAFLRLVPSRGLAVAVLTNGGDSHSFAHDVLTDVLGEHAGIAPLPLPVPPAEPLPLDARYVSGTYRTTGVDFVVTVEDGAGRLTYLARDEIGEMLLGAEEDHAEVVRYRDDALITVDPVGGKHLVYVLGEPDAEGRATSLHYTRFAPRVA